MNVAAFAPDRPGVPLYLAARRGSAVFLPLDPCVSSGMLESTDTADYARHPFRHLFDTGNHSPTRGVYAISTVETRPPKPTRDFPLFAHSNAPWAKKIKGRPRPYGPWADPDAALAKYEGRNGQKQNSVTAPAQTAKPHPDYPLYAHASGQRAKRVRGKTHFFGAWATSRR